jgi:hypothetical protein
MRLADTPSTAGQAKIGKNSPPLASFVLISSAAIPCRLGMHSQSARHDILAI